MLKSGNKIPISLLADSEESEKQELASIMQQSTTVQAI
jgi:hypothetical protein